MKPEELRKTLIDWIESYKDIAERNALAETPTESADYLLSLLREEAEKIKKDNQWGSRLTRKAHNSACDKFLSLLGGKEG